MYSIEIRVKYLNIDGSGGEQGIQRLVPHTFLIIHNPDGSQIGYGFAPQDGYNPVGPGAVTDNTKHPFNVSSGLLNITDAEYSALMNYINNSLASPPEYNLFNGQECTNWVLNGLNEAGIIPDALASFPSWMPDFLNTVAFNPYTESIGFALSNQISSFLDGNAIPLYPEEGYAEALMNAYNDYLEAGGTPDSGLITDIKNIMNSLYDLLAHREAAGPYDDIIFQEWLKDRNACPAGFNAAQKDTGHRDPLILDLDGDGIETIANDPANPILFDHDGNGIKTGTGWIKSDDGFLVLDRNGTGVIDNGSELFGDSSPLNVGGNAADGFAALKDQDTNNDGVVNNLDANWNNLKVWRDMNQDGVSQADELFTMAEAGITSFNVANIANMQILPNTNQIANLGSYTKTDGTTGTVGAINKMADVNLTVDTFNRAFSDTIPVTPEVELLPDMQGSGLCRDLQEAASLSPFLENVLSQYSQATTRQGQMDLLDSLLYTWADTSGLAPTMESRDSEHFRIVYNSFGNIRRSDSYVTGDDGFVTGGGGGNLMLEYVKDIENTWLTESYRQLIVQWDTKLHILEAFNGRYFFTFPNQTQDGGSAATGITVGSANNVGSGYLSDGGTAQYLVINFNQLQLTLLDEAYKNLRESVYESLFYQTRFQTEFAPLLDLIDFTVGSDGTLSFNFTRLEQHFQDEIAVTPAEGMSDLLEFNKYVAAYYLPADWRGNEIMADYYRSLPQTTELRTVYKDFITVDGQAGYKGATGNDDMIAAKNTGSTINGLDGNDVLIGMGGNDHLNGGAGNDTLDGGTGADTMYGNAGNDTYYVDDINDVVYENSYDGAADTVQSYINYTLVASIENLTLIGTSAINGTGNTLDNIITGNSADNTLNGGVGADTMIGGSGDDTYYVDNTGDVVTENANEGTDTVNSSITYTLGSNIENLTLTGTAAITGTGNVLTNVITGNTGANTLYGLEGNDTLDGSTGLDTMLGGIGNDTYVVDNAGDVVTENLDEGTDLVQSSVTYTLSANVENLTLTGSAAINGTGNALNNVIIGNTAANVLNGGTGDDTMIGGAGDDTYIFNSGNGSKTIDDLASANEGNAILFGQGITPDDLTLTLGSLDIRIGNNGDVIHSNNFDPNDAYGTHAVDRYEFTDGTVLSYSKLIGRGFDIIGTPGDDQINGTNAVDRITALDGNDYIVSGAGNDELIGGAGNDTYVFHIGDGVDTIEDTSTLAEGNMILFGEGITASDLTLVRNNGTLIINVGNNGDAINLINFDREEIAGSLVVRTLRFADGIQMNLADFLNRPPVVANPLADQSTLEDAAFTFAIPTNTFADPDAGDSLTYSATLADGTALPSWLTFDPATMTFSGTPTNDNVGILPLKVTSTDTAGASVASDFNVTVINVNDAPIVVNPIADQTTLEDAAFNFTVPGNTFADVDLGDQLTYSASLADGTPLPSWLTFDAATMKFSGTPTNDNVGTLSLKVTATDTSGTSTASSFNVDVINVNDPPFVAHPIADQSTMEDAVFNFTVPGNTFADIDAGDTLTYSATLDDGTALPSWLTFDPATLTFSGTPTNDNVGILPLKVTATDTAGASVADNFNITVENVDNDGIVTYGTNGMDFIITGHDNDLIYALGGIDVVYSGEGNDTIYGGDGIDLLFGDGGNDIIYGENGNDIISGGTGNDKLYGGNGNDYLDGGAGNDTLDGGNGNDTINGGDGSDTYIFRRNDGKDTINECSNKEGSLNTLKLADDIQTNEPVIVKQNDDLYVFTNKDNFVKINNQFEHNTFRILPAGMPLQFSNLFNFNQQNHGVERLEVTDGHYITRQDIETIVNTMSAINNDPGMDVMQKYTAMMNDQQYQNILAQSWK